MPMILTDPNQPGDPIIFVNHAFEVLSGYSAAELIGRNCRLLQELDTDPTQVDEIRQALRERRDVAVEIINHRRDGTPFANKVFISPVFGRDGRLLYHLGSQLNIIGHCQDWRRLQESESRQNAIFDSAVDFAIIATDCDGRVTDWNVGAERILGWTAAEMLGQTVERIFTSEDRLVGQVGTEMRVTLAEGRASDERWYLRRGDIRFWASGEMMPLRGDGGTHAGFLKVLRDRTAQHEAHAVLRDQEARLRLATTSARLGTFDYRIQADELTWDDRCRELFGLPPGAPVSYEDAFLAGLHPEDRAQAHEAAVQSMDPAGSGHFGAEYRTIGLQDGVERWVHANGETLFEDGKPVRLIGTVLDITERKQAEVALRALTETLEQRVADRTAELMHAEEVLRQSQKMEAVGQLTGGLAHDFNNLLTAIVGGLELLSTRVMQGRLTGLDRYIAVAQGAATRAAGLTHRLLAFSRQQTLDPKPTDVNRLVADMEELVRRTVGPAITVEVAGTAGLWPTLVDPNQLESALLNLCINARDAMPEGGRLTIETANRWLDQRAAQERDLVPGQYVSLCVSDTGTGMMPEVVARAFDPFFTTKPLGQGTGLGLSMIYGFVRQSGGQARIYSEPGQGAMVCLYLPRHRGDAEAIEPVPELADALRSGRGETVLVVDDEPSVRMLVTEVLEELGYAAIEAADGASGLRVLRSDVRVDLLVSDVGLPGGMNGRQMADAARVGRPELKVLFITGYAENAVVGNGHLEAGMHVMTKPFAMEALASRIRELIASS